MDIHSINKTFNANEIYLFSDNQQEEDVRLSHLAIMVDRPTIVQFFSVNDPSELLQFKVSYNNIIEFGANITLSKIKFMNKAKALITYKIRETL